MEPWFIAKEVATLLGYENTSRSVNDHVDELDQKMLSHSECKELFGNILNSETLENTDDLKGTISVPLENIGDLSGKNFSLIKIPDSNGRPHGTAIYDLTAFNKLVMTNKSLIQPTG